MSCVFFEVRTKTQPLGEHITGYEIERRTTPMQVWHFTDRPPVWIIILTNGVDCRLVVVMGWDCRLSTAALGLLYYTQVIALWASE
jgi:hypothetical protein